MNLSEWSAEIRVLALLLLFILAGGILFQSYLLFLTIGVISVMVWYLSRLLRLSHLLAAGGALPVFKYPGLLQHLSNQIFGLQQMVEQQERYNTQVVSLFRRAFEAFPDAVMILGRNWRIQWCNGTGKQMFGLDNNGESYGTLVEEVRHPVLEEYLAAGDFSEPLELESPMDWASIMSIQLMPLPEDDDLVLLVARDITRLYHLDQMRKDFVANVSHELKTPLTVIGGFLESMYEDEESLPEQWVRPVELMHQQSERMRGIVDDLLLLSRLDKDHEEFAPATVDVPKLLQDIVVNAEIMAQESEHRINLEIDSSLGLKGERKILESLFYNIIINAVHHTPKGSRIDISWFEESGSPVFQVVDSGDGIPARHLPHLTEPFYRVDSDRSRDSGGTGLGLSIVKRSLARHKGKLSISSEVGQGTVFRCEFPLGCGVEQDGVGEG